MATRPAATAVSIPRFLLPQLTWRAPHLRPAAALPTSASQSSHSGRRRRNAGRHEYNEAQVASVRGVESKQQQLAYQALDWATLTTVAKEQGGAKQDKLIKSLYKALRASFNSSPSLPTSSIATTLLGGPFIGRYAPLQNPSLLQARAFHTSRAQHRDHHFDTLKFVQRLKDEGFSEAQATAMMRVLSDVIEESIQNLTRTMVLREDAERATYTQKVDFTKLRSELLSADNAEAALTRGSHERLANDLAKINSRLRDEIGRTQASVRLDLNLEKGRIREEANAQELKIKETEAKIEQEVAGLRERVEGVKFSTLQWLITVCTGSAAIILGAWRLLM